MTLPASGPMGASAINVELGRASTAPFDINGTAERTLAGKPTGVINFSDFYGKSNVSFSASVSPTSLTRLGTTNTLTTASATATPSGGTGPFTYAWTATAYGTSDGTLTVNSPTAASTTFSSILSVSGQMTDGEAQCVITDTSNSQTRTTGVVTIHIERA